MTESVLHYLPERTDGKQAGEPIPPWTTDVDQVTCKVCLERLAHPAPEGA